MIITISGTAGSGKSTTAAQLAVELKYNHYSMGDLMRAMAKERGMSINEFSAVAEKDRSIDVELDQKQKDLATKDNFVIDGRLSYHFIPNSVKIFLDADIDVRADRILKDTKRGEHHAHEKIVQDIKDREASEKKRYMKYYNLSVKNSDFDLCLDTTHSTKEEVLQKILEFLKSRAGS